MSALFFRNYVLFYLETRITGNTSAIEACPPSNAITRSRRNERERSVEPPLRRKYQFATVDDDGIQGSAAVSYSARRELNESASGRGHGVLACRESRFAPTLEPRDCDSRTRSAASGRQGQAARTQTSRRDGIARDARNDTTLVKARWSPQSTTGRRRGMVKSVHARTSVRSNSC
jgi:hypothetical protein